MLQVYPLSSESIQSLSSLSSSLDAMTFAFRKMVLTETFVSRQSLWSSTTIPWDEAGKVSTPPQPQPA